MDREVHVKEVADWGQGREKGETATGLVGENGRLKPQRVREEDTESER